MTGTFKLAQWVLNMAYPVSSADEWVDMVRAALIDSASRQTAMLLMPEYSCEQWMKFAPADLKWRDELGWMSSIAKNHHVIDKLHQAVKETGVALAAGTMPWPVDDRDGAYTNRAWILFPDRAPIHHDKLVMTPFEKNPEGWVLTPGNEAKIFEWRGVRFALVICLDVEMPALSARLAGEDIDLLLVPSMTEKLSGYHRVFDCAKARAIELMSCVAPVGCVGNPWHGETIRPGNHSGAAVYLPCEEKLGSTGVLDSIAVTNKASGRGEILYTDIPVEAVRALRSKGAEAWPGPWDASHISVKRS